jgi:AraC-like DNA-binding protein
VQDFVHAFQVPGIWRPAGLRAGFHAEPGPTASGLRHAGEQWAPARFLIRRHTHPVWELYLQMRGVSRWSAGGRRFTLGPGHLFAVAPGVVHHMVEESTANHHFYFAGIDPAPLFVRQPALARRWSGLPPVVHRADAAALAEPFHQLMRELTAKRAYPEEGLALAVDRLALEAARLLEPGAATPELFTHPAVTRVRTLLDRTYERHWTLRELAGQVGLAPTYLAGLFVRELGVPPHRYLNECRVRRAAQLLRTSDLPVTAIGIEVGFGSGQHLARVFRQLTGVSPREYRAAGPGRPPASEPLSIKESHERVDRASG